VKNMITGASQADTAVLLCAANDGVNAQTKEHAFLAKVLGVKGLIVHVNKMDISGVDWTEEKYKSACAEVSQLLRMAGFKPDDVPMIPASSLNGDNVYNKSDKCPWYNGPTLFEAINATPMPWQAIRQASPLANSGCLQDLRYRNCASWQDRNRCPQRRQERRVQPFDEGR